MRDSEHGKHEHRRRRAGYLVHLPFALVLLIAAGGVLRIVQYHWRGGSTLLGIALLLAAVLRAMLSDEQVGLLVIRSRPADVLTYSGFGLLVIAVALTIVGGPFA